MKSFSLPFKFSNLKLYKTYFSLSLFKKKSVNSIENYFELTFTLYFISKWSQEKDLNIQFNSKVFLENN